MITCIGVSEKGKVLDGGLLTLMLMEPAHF